MDALEGNKSFMNKKPDNSNFSCFDCREKGHIAVNWTKIRFDSGADSKNSTNFDTQKPDVPNSYFIPENSQDSFSVRWIKYHEIRD